MVFCNDGVRSVLGVLFSMETWVVSMALMAAVTMRTVALIVVSIWMITMTTLMAVMLRGVTVSDQWRCTQWPWHQIPWFVVGVVAWRERHYQQWC